LLVQINTSNHIERIEGLDQELEGLVRDALDRFEEQLTRVEIHLGDENSEAKGGVMDIRCTVEARLAGRAPIAVSHYGATVEQATEGALKKMRSSLDTVIGKLERR
jgi:hypothetical protein